VKPAKIEILLKVVVWRMFSMCYGFTIAYFFTGNAAEAVSMVIITGTTLTILQWLFEIGWDKHIRSEIRDALSGQQGRIGWMVWVRRDSRSLRLDKHKQGDDGREAWKDSQASQDAR
jgi:uncharacterized membrane protein